jgi:hypothetical protein
MFIDIEKVLAVVETDQGWTILFEGGERVEWLSSDCLKEILERLSKR